jgi:hypothetical protein
VTVAVVKVKDVNMENLPISAGWVFLIAGIAGMVTVTRAKTFSWKNYEFLTSEEDRKQEVPMTPTRRWILIAICVGLAAYGAIRVQQDRDWNPLHKGGVNAQSSVH